MKLENVIYCGDNLIWLKKFPDKFVDLIYLDPPFFSNKKYEVIFHDGQEIRSFEDRWKGGINHYIGWMRERIFEMHRVLKGAGSFYLHCDWHASHYLKVMCDDVFGYKNFQNEIIWSYSVGGKSKNKFARKHDNIFFYSKGKKYTFNGEAVKLPRKTGHSSFGGKIGKDENGRLYQDKRTKKGKIYRYYLDEGKIPEDVWIDIQSIQSQNKERFGYPTQKPEVLMERIIKASSDENHLVADFFCGCGTTIAVAQRLQRKWIGIDVSPSACKLMKNRVEKNGAIGIEIIGLPVNIDDLKSLEPFEFQNWCIGALGGTVNPKKVGDMGIDGFTFMLRDPIQVKQSENIGRNVIDNFETAMQRIKKTKGCIIAFSFGKGAYEEVARAKQNGLFIELLTIDKLLEYEEPSREGKIF